MTNSPKGAADRRNTLPRTVLSIPDRPHTGSIRYDAKYPDTTFPDIVPLRPPSGAPNVLLILLDDVGFGASATFGGPCATLTADRLAAAGIRYRRFHTTALCSPTRAALLSGRNRHRRHGRCGRHRHLGTGLPPAPPRPLCDAHL